MRLALAFGRPDVDRLMRELSSADLVEWAAFEALEGGFGARGVWYANAQLAALYAEAHRDAKKRSKPFSPADFLPWVDRPAPSAAAFRAGFGNVVKVKKKRS